MMLLKTCHVGLLGLFTSEEPQLAGHKTTRLAADGQMCVVVLGLPGTSFIHLNVPPSVNLSR